MTVHVSNSMPYAWPFDGELDGARLALIVIASGRGPAVGAVVTERIDALSSQVRAAGGVVVHVATQADVPAVPDAAAAHRAAEADFALTSFGVDGFYESPLEHILRSHGHDTLLLVGGGLETSVHSTMRSANDRGFECLLIADACEPVDVDLVASALSMIHMSGGIFGATADTAAVLSAINSVALEGVPS